ncbi:MAG: CpsD/CapB family tyrosine-protein kinase [Clostridia bacterium]
MKDKKPGSKLLCYSESRSPVAEAYRTLRTNILFIDHAKIIKTLMVTSAQPDEGKTTTICNLAIVFAQSGKRVLIVDGDLRKPSLHRMFRLPNQKGLTDLLLHEDKFVDVVQSIEDMGIDVLTSGTVPPNPTELIGTPYMRELLRYLTNQYDLVLVDTPPVLPVSDSQVFASFLDAVLLVVRSGIVKIESAQKAKSLLEHVGANVIGVILNDKQVDDSAYMYYEYGEKGS